MKLIAKLLGLDEAATEEQILDALKEQLDLSEFAKALDLKDDATSEEILEAIKAKDEETTEQSLEDRAKAEGKVVLSTEEAATMRADSKAGREAADKLLQRDFDEAFDRALKDPKGARVDTKDETRERYQKLYDAEPEATIETLDALPPLVNAKPAGLGGGPGSNGEAPDNVDEDRHELNEKVKARMREDKIEYGEALELVLADEETG